MSDLVERLRKLAERERPYGSLPDTLDEAATEIERLRAALVTLSKYQADEDEMDWAETVLAMNKIARAALAEEKHDD